jgi:hypothetical protein
MQTVNFPCPSCNNLMAVGLNLLGRSVRCPHCKTVVVAPRTPDGTASLPANAPPPAPPPGPSVSIAPHAPTISMPPAVSPPAPPAPEPPLPTFSLPAPPREAYDSIFGDAHEEDLFGEHRKQVPELPAAPPRPPEPPPFVPAPAPAPAPYMPPPAPAPAVFAPQAPPPAPFLPPPEPPAPAADPFAFGVAGGVAPTVYEPPAPFAPPPAPPPAPYAPPATVPFAPAAANPFAPPSTGFTPPSPAWPAVAAPPPAPEPYAPPAPAAPPAAPRRRPAPAPINSGQMALVALMFLVPYAFLATGLIGWLMFQRSRMPSWYEALPDVNREYPASRRGPVTPKSGVSFLPKVDLPLPEFLRTGLGQTLEVGQLAVTPEKIELRPVTAFQVPRGGGEPETKESKGLHLVLTLRLKNISQDVYFCPTDPAFNRSPRNGNDPVYTGVQVPGKAFFAGGPFSWPVSGRVERLYFEGQEDDGHELAPGEERTALIVAAGNSQYKGFTDTVASAGAPMLWRVHLRRGLLPVRGEEIPVTAVVGVRFTSSDIIRRAAKG